MDSTPNRSESAPSTLAVPWTRRELLWVGLAGIACMLGLTLVLTVTLDSLERGMGVLLPKQVRSGVSLLAELGLILPVWWFGLRRHGLSWSAVGLRRFNVAKAVSLGCFAWSIALAGTMAWGVLLSLFGGRAQPDMLPLFGGGLGGLLAALLAGGLVAPFAEEVFFRGFLYAGLRQHFGLRHALWINGVLFALIHVLPTSWPPIFLLAILFAALYQLTDSLWPAVAVHVVVNSLSFILLYLTELTGH